MAQQSNYDRVQATGPGRALKTLLLDDDAYDRSRIRRLSKKTNLSMDIQDASSIKAMAELIEEDAYDLIMIDYNLTEGDGFDALELIQQHSANKDAAVIMISGDQRRETAVSAFRQGCHDYISKDELSPANLQRSVSEAMNVSRINRPDHGALNQNALRELDFHIHDTLNRAITSEAMQAALLHEMRKAAKSVGLSGGFERPFEADAFFEPDEFIFKQ